MGAENTTLLSTCAGCDGILSPLAFFLGSFCFPFYCRLVIHSRSTNFVRVIDSFLALVCQRRTLFFCVHGFCIFWDIGWLFYNVDPFRKTIWWPRVWRDGGANGGVDLGSIFAIWMGKSNFGIYFRDSRAIFGLPSSFASFWSVYGIVVGRIYACHVGPIVRFFFDGLVHVRVVISLDFFSFINCDCLVCGSYEVV